MIASIAGLPGWTAITASSAGGMGSSGLPPGSAEMQAKSHYEPKFAIYVWERVSEYGNFTEKELLDSFSYRSRASQVTLKRYLDSYCSADGPCRRSKDSDGNVIVAFKFPVPPKNKQRSKR